jgi:hypothetical protein
LSCLGRQEGILNGANRKFVNKWRGKKPKTGEDTANAGEQMQMFVKNNERKS